MRMHPVEKLRRIWTPGREIEEVIAELSPQSELDSMIRDWLHRICEQKGPQKLVLAKGGVPVLNEGNLRFEIVTHEPTPGQVGHQEITLWVEK